jgi:hypothetical protein
MFTNCNTSSSHLNAALGLAMEVLVVVSSVSLNHHIGVCNVCVFAARGLLTELHAVQIESTALARRCTWLFVLLQLRTQIAQNLAHLKGPPGVQFHERAPDAMDVDELPNLEPKVCCCARLTSERAPAVTCMSASNCGVIMHGCPGLSLITTCESSGLSS